MGITVNVAPWITYRERGSKCLVNREVKYTFSQGKALPPTGGDRFISLCSHYRIQFVCSLLCLPMYIPLLYFNEGKSIPVNVFLMLYMSPRHRFHCRSFSWIVYIPATANKAVATY